MFFIALVAGYLSCRWRSLQRRWQPLRPESLHFHVRIPFHCGCQDAVPIRIKAPSVFGESPLLLGAPARPLICFQQIFGLQILKKFGIQFRDRYELLEIHCMLPYGISETLAGGLLRSLPGRGVLSASFGEFRVLQLKFVLLKGELEVMDSCGFSLNELRSSCHWNRASHFHCIGFLNAFEDISIPFFSRPFATRGWSTSASSTNCVSPIVPDVRKLVQLSGMSLTSCFFCESWCTVM